MWGGREDDTPVLIWLSRDDWVPIRRQMVNQIQQAELPTESPFTSDTSELISDANLMV